MTNLKHGRNTDDVIRQFNGAFSNSYIFERNLLMKFSIYSQDVHGREVFCITKSIVQEARELRIA